nr:immunoglobulin heavy chain junction region [Macaca mulatta]
CTRDLSGYSGHNTYQRFDVW